MRLLSMTLAILAIISCGENTNGHKNSGNTNQDALSPPDSLNAPDSPRTDLLYRVKDCENQPNGTPCDDNNLCTLNESCKNGSCVGDENRICEDNVACLEGTCKPEEGCVYVNAVDGSTCKLACVSKANCQAGTCKPDLSTAISCPKSTNDCVDQLQCDTTTGLCTIEILKTEGTSCNSDADVCTLETCNGSGECTNSGELNKCTTQQQNNPCWTYSCNKKSGCATTLFVEGASCDDNNPCTYSDICTISELSQKLCRGAPLPINDQNPCTDDVCNNGLVSHTPIDGLSCAVDGCELSGTCVSGACDVPQGCLCDPVDGGWSEYIWGDCSSPCGEGIRIGVRTCTEPTPGCGGFNCEGEDSIEEDCVGETLCDEFETCAEGKCVASCAPVNGAWSPWSEGECSALCGSGVSLHTRTCDSPAPSCGGAGCQGESAKTVSCNGATQCGPFEACQDGQCKETCSPISGDWSNWNWQQCNVACGPGEQLGTRSCDSPAPSCGGAGCQGESAMFVPCNGQGCGEFEACESGKCQSSCQPINGGWTNWVWSACSVECGGGIQTGSRSCTAPTSQCGGAPCAGKSQMVNSCNTQACINYLPLGVTSYTSGAQVVTGVVPAGVTNISVSAWGAGGGGGFPGRGGGGAYVVTSVTVNPGDEVELRVGSKGVAYGGGGGASYMFVNGQAVVIAAGGGGAGSDGCGGCKQAIGSAANGGAGGGVGESGQAGTENNKYSTGSGGGIGASPNGPGMGGVSTDNNPYNYSGCNGNGASGGSHKGGGGHGANLCKPGANGATYHLGGTKGHGNGGGGGGGGGLFGGGGGAGKYTYSGGGGGGGSSWTNGSTSNVISEGGSYQQAGGTKAAYYKNGHARGGDAGDHTNWPSNYWGPSAGKPGLVVIVL